MKKGSQKYVILKFMQENYNKSYLISDFMGFRFFRKAPFVWYSASTLIPKMKRLGLLEVTGTQINKKIFSSRGRSMNLYSITLKGLNFISD